MKKWMLVGGAVLLIGLLWWSQSAPTFTIIKPFVAPASPSGLAVTKASPAPTASFPLAVQVDGHGHATRNITVTMDLLTSPTAQPVSFQASTLVPSGNTITGTATRPNRNAFVNTDTVKMTWSGQFNLVGVWFPFSGKATTVRFPAFVVMPSTIPSRGSGPVKISLTPPLDFPVTIDLTGNQGISLSSSSVTIPANQTQPASVTITAPVWTCGPNPILVPGGTCLGAWMDLSSKFGGTAIVVAERACVPIQCE